LFLFYLMYITLPGIITALNQRKIVADAQLSTMYRESKPSPIFVMTTFKIRNTPQTKLTLTVVCTAPLYFNAKTLVVYLSFDVLSIDSIRPLLQSPQSRSHQSVCG